MFNLRQSILASSRASIVLALLLFAALTAPFVMLQSTHVFAAAAALPCTEGNHNGCTELSATPPEDLQSVPPNLVLMLDDSGSMAWDFMPDWAYLSNSGVYGTRNSGVNAVYYNPQTTYTPPPKATATGTVWQADGTWYPNSPSMTTAYRDGFTTTSAVNIVGGSGYVGGGNGKSFNYTDNLATTQFSTTPPVDKGPAVWGGGTSGSPGTPGGGCIANYYVDPGNPNQCIRDPVSATHSAAYCDAGDGSPYNSGGTKMCHHRVWEEGVQVDYPYSAHDGGWVCPAGSTGPDGSKMCYFTPIGLIPPTPPTNPTPDHWQCLSGGSYSGTPADYPAAAPECWTSGTSTRIYVRGFTYVVGNPIQTNSHYVIPRSAGAPAAGWCSVLYYAWQKTNCVNADDTTGTAAPTGITADQNVANWFSYYRTRMLMAKSGLMTAFSTVDPKYRFGFSSINGNGTSNIPTSPTAFDFDDSTADGTGGNAANKLAVVQPFGDGSSGTQKAQFWTWLANVSASKGTPLRKALSAVGQYYQTAQPWTTMSTDPGWTTGSTAQFTCRASYTILTTDGFWNGDDPGVSGMANAASVAGPVNTVPTGNVTQYTAVAPYSGGAVASGDTSLADVATYYWERDLNTSFVNDVSASKADPASWQHMTTYTIGLGFNPVGIQPAGTTVPQILGWATGGAAISGFSWPSPASDSLNNIADLAHAAVNGHGDFFNVNNPADLALAFSKAISDIGARNVAPKSVAVNASVLALGATAFRSGYQTGDWSGQFQAVTLKADGTADQLLWTADTLLDAAYHSPTSYSSRVVYTAAYTSSGTFNAFKFNVANKASLDTSESTGLQTPALAGGNDTLDNRINYLLGDNSYEAAPYRTRSSILGAILHADPVYVGGATGNYRNSWPTFGAIVPPEAASTAQAYTSFVQAQATQPGTVYVGANDGMLHAFNAPVPQCTGTIDSDGNCSTYTFATGANQGQEAWAFMPRAVYANLGNLTNASDFKFRPTVDSTPVARDVFFSDKKWHTILTGGVGLGGRGVYALDITDPGTFAATDVLWEFDADMTVATTCVTSYETCKATDLGYTVAQPNVARLANGKWVVLVPNGYFPDCSTPDAPTGDTASCNAIAAQAPKDASGKPYSALFVIDAQTGKMIAELKTPTNLGVTSFGLAKPVLGDYNSDQVDDVAFAGDVQGNLWRFDLSDTNPANWAVTLVYKGVVDASGNQGVQPITTMPRLFADPDSNRFLVVFGTGKYLGVGDNSNNNEQAFYAVRDKVGTTYTQADLTQQYLHETVAPATLPDGSANPIAGATLRCITGGVNDTCSATATAINTVSSSSGGWFVNLYTADSGVQNNTGERVVVNPAAIFATNTVIFETLITGAQGSDACNPSTQGAILALDATTGGPAGMSTLGGWPIAGGRIDDAATSGSLPIVSALGGGRWIAPGASLSGTGGSGSGTSGSTGQVGGDQIIARRRSWRVLMNDQ